MSLLFLYMTMLLIHPFIFYLRTHVSAFFVCCLPRSIDIDLHDFFFFSRHVLSAAARRVPIRAGVGENLRHAVGAENRPQGRVRGVAPGLQSQARRRRETAPPRHARLLQEARVDLTGGLAGSTRMGSGKGGIAATLRGESQ